MTSLNDIRKQHPIGDREVYDRAYAEADLAGRLAEVVYRLRTGARLTQTELARRMGTTQSAVARVEGGGSTPTLDLLDRVGRAVGVEIVLAVGGDVLHFGVTGEARGTSAGRSNTGESKSPSVSVSDESVGSEEVRSIPNIFRLAA